MLCGTDPFPEKYRAKKYKIHQKFLSLDEFRFIMRFGVMGDIFGNWANKSGCQGFSRNIWFNFRKIWEGILYILSLQVKIGLK